MLFSSFSFLFWFLPLTLALYFLPSLLSGRRLLGWQNGVLLAASLFFYAWGEPLYLFFMLGVIFFDTVWGLLLERRHSRALLALGVALHLSLLFYFKYAHFFLGLIGLPISPPALPLGISFYSFQALSYLLDIWAGRVRAERSPFRLGLYIALFPQLIAGPIVRYTDVNEALSSRHHSLGLAAAGIRRFSVGLAKKLVLANPCGALFSTLAARGAALSVLGALTALLSFAFQLYFDFSGYSDMAIGLSRVFGFSFPENFKYPYTARNITDFWRRWHITLSSFFRVYLYFPLGGSRRGRGRTVFNLLVVWSLTGLWHGASFNFIFWGLYYFLLLTLEKFLLEKPLSKIPPPLAHALTLVAVLFGWLLFAFDGSAPYLSFSALPSFLAALLGANGLSAPADLYELVRHLPILALCALGSTPLPRRLYRGVVSKKRQGWLRTALPLAALLIAVVELSAAGFNPFLYFRF